MSFPYFYGRAAEQYAFYRIPKLLFSDERFEALSTDAKLLYGMLDRPHGAFHEKRLDG